MTNTLEKVICAEIVEKILRTENFLYECILQERPENQQLITHFIKEVDKTKEYAKEAIINLISMERGESFHLDGKLSTFKKLIGASVIIEDVIARTRYIRGVKARPETDVFVKRLLLEVSCTGITTKPSIILFPVYNFFYGNLLSPVASILFEGEMSRRERIPRNPIISLPNIAYMNPLMWGILIHEIGHEIENSNNTGISIVRKMELKGSPDDLKLTEDWIIEFFSDLFALRTLGPAFLIPNIIFSLLKANLKDPHLQHPPAYDRIEVLYNYLRNKMKIKHEVTEEYMKILKERHDLMPNVTMFQLFKIESIDEKEKLPSFLLKFSEVIDAIDPELDRFSTEIFQGKRLKICDFLAKELGKGIPICSTAKGKNSFEKISKTDLKKECGFEQLIENFVERPASMSEILNACWISKFNDDYSKFSEIFLEKKITSTKDYFERFRNFGEYLNYKDSLIMKSIETSDIFHIFGEVDENDIE